MDRRRRDITKIQSEDVGSVHPLYLLFLSSLRVNGAYCVHCSRAPNISVAAFYMKDYNSSRAGQWMRSEREQRTAPGGKPGEERTSKHRGTVQNESDEETSSGRV